MAWKLVVVGIGAGVLASFAYVRLTGAHLVRRREAAEHRERKTHSAYEQLLFEHSPVPMGIYDRETNRLIAGNRAVLQLLGYAAEEYVGKSIFDLVSVDQRARAREMAGNPEGKVDPGFDWQVVTKDGRKLDVEVHARSTTYQGKNARLTAIVDMTGIRRAEESRRSAQEFLAEVVENVPVPIAVKEPVELRYVLLNRAAEQFLGVPRSQVIGQRAAAIFDRATAERITRHDNEVLRTNGAAVAEEHVIETPGNGPRLVKTKRLPLHDATGKISAIIALFEDITERRQSEEALAYLSQHDPLTELPNRAAFMARLARELGAARAHDEQFALICIDVDRFKEVNDVFGHSVGDQLFKEIAVRLREVVQEHFLARPGGGELTAIVAGPQPETARIVCRRMAAAMARDFEIGDYRLDITLSLGAAVFPEDGRDVATLLGNADAALYQAKAHGRGAVHFFDAETDKRLREKRSLQVELKRGFESGEFLLHYQPLASIGGEILGFEALLRWRHRSRGLIPPDEFIPLAEEGGMIFAMGEWALRESCREAARWSRPLRLAVNVSPIQFRHADLANVVQSVLLETGLRPERLELEITEGALISNFNRALTVLTRLKTIGVKISIDDFGTGYSSLGYLHAFPLDQIKMDRRFVTGAPAHPQSAAIVRSIIGLARGLSLTVIAEGVETHEQLRFLADEGCDEIQGFILGRPGPIDHYGEIVHPPRQSAIA